MAFGMAAAIDPVEMAPVAQRIAVAHQEHGEPVIVAAMLADLLALVEMRHGDAVDAAAERFVGDPAHGIVERDIPGDPEALRIRAAGEGIGAFRRHADAPAGIADAAAFGERADEIGLPPRRPAVMAGPHADGFEGGERLLRLAAGAGRFLPGHS